LILPSLWLASLLAAAEHKTSAAVDAQDARAIALLAKGHIKEASELLSRSIKEDPLDARAYANRATARLQLKEYEGAIADFNAAVKLAPKLKASLLARTGARALAARGQARLAGGKLDGAVDDFTAAIRLDGKNAPAYAGIGWAALSRGETKNALDYFDRAISLDPSTPAYREGRAEAARLNAKK
jgi:tetratricopeptide (TPR) repeat protein